MAVTTQREECTATDGGRLLMSMELSRRQWKLGFTTGVGRRPRPRTLSTDSWDRLPEEIAAAKRRFRLRRCAGDELLRGGPRWVLDPPISDQPGDQESGGGLVEHRGESTRPARQDRSDG